MFQDFYEFKTQKSRVLYDEARRFLPGGVSYAIKYWEPYPIYVSRAKGSKICDVDGNEYLDFWMGHTAIIMGHAYEPVIKAAKEQLELGAHLGFCHEWEVKLAEIITKMVPSVKLFRATNSGTEANMYAIRLARAYTGKRKIAKFEGHWHGGYDALHKAVNPPLDKPASLGLTECVMSDTIVLPFNDLEGVRQKVKGEPLACIILEPVMGSNGMIPADREFLKGLRELCDELDILLIFDEVITGFRLAKGGAQEYYGVLPDITTFGKVLGGGIFPAGGFGGREDIMELLDQTKRKHYETSFHGGTYAGNPLTTRAGYTLLSELIKGEVYPKINALGEKARKGLEDIFSRYKIDAHVTGVGSLFSIHFTKEKPKDVRSAIGDTKLTKDCFYFLLRNNILCMKPSKQVFAPSAAHSEEDIEYLLSVMEDFSRRVSAQ
ncbi:MAG: aspartate aminotransferase family protein [Nitrososphaerota archaeon]|nr:aspartate aminotransferase family protein [Aigarchaeota archaeon]MDW8076914.1 aspartate aminotransferase family protein [Nitrososphaerota archaeon]